MSKNESNLSMSEKGLFREIQNESERGAVIFAAAYIDAQLGRLLSLSFVKKDPQVVNDLLKHGLSEFNNRLKAAYCMGLINKTLYSDLDKLRQIRNKFAHELFECSFNDPEVEKLCNSFVLANMYSSAIPDFPHSPKDKFIVAVAEASTRIWMKTFEVEKNNSSLLNDDDSN